MLLTVTEYPKAELDINPAKATLLCLRLKTEDHQVALAEVRRLQRDTKFKDAWVFRGLGEGGSGVDVEVPKENLLLKNTRTVELLLSK